MNMDEDIGFNGTKFVMFQPPFEDELKPIILNYVNRLSDLNQLATWLLKRMYDSTCDFDNSHRHYVNGSVSDALVSERHRLDNEDKKMYRPFIINLIEQELARSI